MPLSGQLFDAGHAAALGISIGTAAQVNIHAGLATKFMPLIFRMRIRRIT